MINKCPLTLMYSQVESWYLMNTDTLLVKLSLPTLGSIPLQTLHPFGRWGTGKGHGYKREKRRKGGQKSNTSGPKERVRVERERVSGTKGAEEG